MATVESIAAQPRIDENAASSPTKANSAGIAAGLIAGNKASGGMPAVNPPVAALTQSSVVTALVAWLRWNDAYEQVTSAMFDQRSNLQQLQETLDQADELRRKARSLTEQLLAEISRSPNAGR